jgi:hypothetical protein
MIVGDWAKDFIHSFKTEERGRFPLHVLVGDEITLPGGATHTMLETMSFNDMVEVNFYLTFGVKMPKPRSDKK